MKTFSQSPSITKEISPRKCSYLQQQGKPKTRKTGSRSRGLCSFLCLLAEGQIAQCFRILIFSNNFFFVLCFFDKGIEFLNIRLSPSNYEARAFFFGLDDELEKGVQKIIIVISGEYKKRLLLVEITGACCVRKIYELNFLEKDYFIMRIITL